MSVLILYSGKYPGSSPGAKRIGYYQRGLEAAGLKTEIKTISLKSKQRIVLEIEKLLLPFKTFFLFLKWRRQYDILFIYGFNWLTYVLLSLICRFSNVKLYLEINEKPGTVYGNRLSELKLMKFFYVVTYRFSLRFIDGFVVISEALKTYLKPYTDKGAHLIIIPIIIDIERKGLHAQSLVTHDFLLHAGALSDRKDGIGELIEAFALVCKKISRPFHLYFTSKQAPKELLDKINQVISLNDLADRVHFLGNISESNLLAYQKYCRMLVINKHINDQNLHNFPTKLGEFLILERPVITTGVGEMGKYLKHNENSIIVPVNNVPALANAILYILNNPEVSKRLAENGKITAQTHFNFMIQGKRLAEFLNLKSEAS